MFGEDAVDSEEEALLAEAREITNSKYCVDALCFANFNEIPVLFIWICVMQGNWPSLFFVRVYSASAHACGCICSCNCVCPQTTRWWPEGEVQEHFTL